MDYKFIVSSSPHIHKEESISSIMLDVIIALIPAAICGIYSFGYRAALVLLTSMAACVISEYAYEKLMKKNITTSDCSALLTGLLLGLNLPPAIPLWMAACGGFFAIVVVKQLYGGLGKNFMNPALAAEMLYAYFMGGRNDILYRAKLRSTGCFIRNSACDIKRNGKRKSAHSCAKLLGTHSRMYR